MSYRVVRERITMVSRLPFHDRYWHQLLNRNETIRMPGTQGNECSRLKQRDFSRDAISLVERQSHARGEAAFRPECPRRRSSSDREWLHVLRRLCFALQVSGRAIRDSAAGLQSQQRAERWIERRDFVPMSCDLYTDRPPKHSLVHNANPILPGLFSFARLRFWVRHHEQIEFLGDIRCRHQPGRSCKRFSCGLANWHTRNPRQKRASEANVFATNIIIWSNLIWRFYRTGHDLPC